MYIENIPGKVILVLRNRGVGTFFLNVADVPSIPEYPDELPVLTYSSVSVPAGIVQIFGPFSENFENESDNCIYFQVGGSAEWTDVDVAAIRFPE
jgi:Na+-transporting NADH:ubiquinone oxidoreductase subunit NqrF